MTFSPFLVANARHVARDDADRVPLAALAGSTGAVGIFVGRHGRIRADSRDSARACRFATSSRRYQLGDRRTATEEDGAILQTSALPLGYGANFADLCLTTWLRRQLIAATRT